MTDTSWVQSRVVDIRRGNPKFPKNVAVDANALYFCNYAHFDQLRMAGGNAPQHYQTSAYPGWWGKALKSGTKCFTALATLGEFVRLVEYAELEMLWMTAPGRSSDESFSPKIAKSARYEYAGNLPRIREQSRTSLNSLLKTVNLLPRFPSEDVEASQVCDEWQKSIGDFADASLVSAARHVGRARPGFLYVVVG